MGSKQKSNISFDISKNVKIDLKNVYFKDGSEIKRLLFNWNFKKMENLKVLVQKGILVLMNFWK